MFKDREYGDNGDGRSGLSDKRAASDRELTVWREKAGLSDGDTRWEVCRGACCE